MSIFSKIADVNNKSVRFKWLTSLLILAGILLLMRLFLGLATDLENSTDPDVVDSIQKRPWTLWVITQFTWLTTFLTIGILAYQLYCLIRGKAICFL